eukprot:5062263-Lingulodinium_polyedra.AAC.2
MAKADDLALGYVLPTSSKCKPLTLRELHASPFQSASVDSSSWSSSRSLGASVPTNSSAASDCMYAIRRSRATSSGTVHLVTLVVSRRTAVDKSGRPTKDANKQLAT